MLPVTKVLHSVLDFLSDIHTIDIKSILANGLQNKIEMVDFDGGNTTFSHITGGGQVVLSIGYCQLLWNICYVALRQSELQRFEESCKEFHVPSNIVRDFILSYKLSEFDYLKKCFSSNNDLDMIKKGYACLKPLSFEDLQFFQKIDMDDAFSRTVNGVCSAGITFVLLHELFHWERGHFERSMRRIEMECEADDYAFDTLLNNYCGKQKNTAIMGALCAFISFFFLNPEFNNDGNYPFEDERLFAQYNKVNNCDTYTLVVGQSLKYWLTILHPDKELKDGFVNSKVNLEQIRVILRTIGR